MACHLLAAVSSTDTDRGKAITGKSTYHLCSPYIVLAYKEVTNKPEEVDDSYKVAEYKDQMECL